MSEESSREEILDPNVDYDETKANESATNFDDFRQKNEPTSVETVIAEAMRNFAPVEANYAISHKLIAPVAALEGLEIRWLEWVSIPEGMNSYIVSDRLFLTDMFEKAIRFSASRKGMGRDQIAEVLASYMSQGASRMGVVERIKQRFMPKEVD